MSSMNDNEKDLVKGLLNNVFKQDPKAALGMLQSALLMPTLLAFMKDNDMSSTMTLTIKKGEVIFLYAACMRALASMSNDTFGTIDSLSHLKISDDYKGVTLTLAEIAETIGYPCEGMPAKAISAIYAADKFTKDTMTEYEQCKDGIISPSDIVERES